MTAVAQGHPGPGSGLAAALTHGVVELRAQRDALEQELVGLEQAAKQQTLRLATVAGKTVPETDEMTAVLLLRLGIVNDALAALRDAPYQRNDAA